MPRLIPDKKALIKATLLVAFIAVVFVVLQTTGLSARLTPQNIDRLLSAAGIWAPLVYVLGYALGVCLFLPGSLLGGLGAALFGAFQGFVWTWLGAMLGAAGGFWIGRYLGRGAVAGLIGDRLEKYDAAIAENGFATVLYLRLLYFPFTPLNFAMGLTGIRFRDYWSGTGLGILVGTFVFTFFIGTLRNVWASGQWGQLLSVEVFAALGLFGFSFFIPALVKRFRSKELR